LWRNDERSRPFPDPRARLSRYPPCRLLALPLGQNQLSRRGSPTHEPRFRPPPKRDPFRPDRENVFINGSPSRPSTCRGPTPPRQNPLQNLTRIFDTATPSPIPAPRYSGNAPDRHDPAIPRKPPDRAADRSYPEFYAWSAPENPVCDAPPRHCESRSHSPASKASRDYPNAETRKSHRKSATLPASCSHSPMAEIARKALPPARPRTSDFHTNPKFALR